MAKRKFDDDYDDYDDYRKVDGKRRDKNRNNIRDQRRNKLADRNKAFDIEVDED